MGAGGEKEGSRVEPTDAGDGSERRQTALTDLLAAASAGDSEAFDRLIPLVYDDLREIAHRHLSGEREGHTLNTTALVHEAYLRLVDHTQASWTDRSHFFAVASRVMRHILIDYARQRGRKKRGGDVVRVSLGRSGGPNRRDDAPDVIELLALDQALDRLTERHERMGRVVECRLFGGMRMKEIAGALRTSLSTVERDWRRAKAYLYRDLSPEARG